MSSSRSIGSSIGTIFGFGGIGLMVLVWGFFLSEKFVFTVLHEVVLVAASLVFCLSTYKSPSGFKRKLLFFLVFVMHFALFSVEKGEMFFSLRILSLIFPYLFVAVFGGAFIPLYVGRASDTKIRISGMDVTAIVTEVWDAGARFQEDGVSSSYKMKLMLEKLDHPNSPYKVTGIFWVSEFFIHRLKSGPGAFRPGRW